MPEQPDPKLRMPAVIQPKDKESQVVASPAYAELDIVTNFSFLRGASHPDELVCQAAELGHSAIGIADVNSLAGVVRAHRAAKQVGLKLCVGTRLRFSDSPDVLAWAENRDGYANLCRILTAGKRRTEKGECDLRLEDLLGSSTGLLAAIEIRGIDPEISIRKEQKIQQTAYLLEEAMKDRVWISISRMHDHLDGAIFHSAEDVSSSCGIPLLATNQVHYHDVRRRMLQDVLACVRHGCTIEHAGFRLFSNGERVLKSPWEMRHLFEDLPHAVTRSNEIAQRCAFSLDELKYEYPDEIVPAGKTALQYLAELAWAGANERYPSGIPKKVRGQIEHELRLIEELKIAAYFLTVYDLVRFARSRGILCQGRGSAANSAVCFCVGVTSVDPGRVDVLFERFISAARNEPPDIDIDFEHERREEVIQYVYEKYGRDRAAMTAEVITYRARSAIRDVGKAMGLGLDTVDQMAKRQDWWDRGVLNVEKLGEIGLDPEDRSVRLALLFAGQILGFPRHLSQHVGGMVISRRPMCESVPIENAAMQDRTVIEWDKDDLDAVGMFKVDVLGLGMLTALSKGLKFVNDFTPGEKPIELHTIPAEDKAVYDMASDADTIGVFQIESRAQMSMLPRLKPDNFYDLVIEVAIVRPGPIQGNMVHPYLRRRAKEEKVSFPKPELEAVLGKTLGVPLFQEQAMKMVMVAAGFSAEEADRLRRSMAAWRYTGHIEQFHRKVVDGMIRNGYDPAFAEQSFDQIKGFGEYGFPESHAASFALLVYASCWLKRYHPAAFCAALLNSQPMGFYAPAQIVRDAREHGVEMRPVDVNCSNYDCTLEESDPHPCPLSDCRERGKSEWGLGGPAVRLGFRMVKGLQSAFARRIEEARKRCGRFESVDHFHETVGLQASAVMKLAEADAFESLPKTRRPALWDALALPDERPPMPIAKPDDSEEMSLFPMTSGEEILADYGTVGLSLKGHPVAIVREELKKRRIISAADVWKKDPGRWVSVAGIVLIRQRPGTASGIVFITLEDETGIVNLIVRPNVYERYRAAARHASLVQADGYIERQGKVQHIMTARLVDLTDVLSGFVHPSRDFR
jgi:error-prone DNA polymerase